MHHIFAASKCRRTDERSSWGASCDALARRWSRKWRGSPSGRGRAWSRRQRRRRRQRLARAATASAPRSNIIDPSTPRLRSRGRSPPLRRRGKTTQGRGFSWRRRTGGPVGLGRRRHHASPTTLLTWRDGRFDDGNECSGGMGASAQPLRSTAGSKGIVKLRT